MRLILDTCILLVLASTQGPLVQAQEPLDLATLHGRVVYVDFWASWCIPCRLSFPWLEKLQCTYRAQGLTVVAVNLDRERADAETFLHH
jgi:thiol-disulfide isomerase/thioredoxin